MIRTWVFEGEMEDPYQEFFIDSDVNISYDQLWHSKYKLVSSAVPPFITQTLAQRILTIGKSIQFIRHVCKDAEWVMDKSVAIALNHHGKNLQKNLNFLRRLFTR